MSLKKINLPTPKELTNVPYQSLTESIARGPAGPPGPTGDVSQNWVVMFDGSTLNQTRLDYPFVLWVGTGGFPTNAMSTDLIVRLDITI